MPNRATSRPSGTVAFVEAIGAWADGSGPLVRKLERSVASAIERGALDGGTRLPSERAVAATLAIGRGTAVAAYDALVAEGLVERRRGSGTYVVASGELRLPQGREGSALVHRLVDRSEGATEDVVDISLAVLRDATGLPAARVTTQDLMTVQPDTGYTPWGLSTL